MVQLVFQRVLRLGATIATALAGMGSLATAVGFLAERARWNMLGFHSPGVDMNEYLFNGALFLVFLPAVFLTSIPDALWLNPWLGLVLLGVGGLVILLRGGRDAGTVSGRFAQARARSRAFLPRLRLPALALFVVGLLIGTAYLLRATTVVNVLFTDQAALSGFRCGQPGLGLREHILLQCEPQLLAHLGQGFLLVTAGMIGFWLLLPEAWKPDTEAVPPRGAEAVLMWLSVALLTLQVMLLPINYGITYLRTDVPAVQVTPTAAEVEREGWRADGFFVLLQRRGDEFYLYSSLERRIWLLPRGQIETLVYLGTCPVLALPERCRPGLAGGAEGVQ
jgi:hypothetical protein